MLTTIPVEVLCGLQDRGAIRMTVRICNTIWHYKLHRVESGWHATRVFFDEGECIEDLQTFRLTENAIKLINLQIDQKLTLCQTKSQP